MGTDACSAEIGAAIAAGLPEVLVVAWGDVQDDLYIVGCELMAPDTAGSGAHLLSIGCAQRAASQRLSAVRAGSAETSLS